MQTNQPSVSCFLLKRLLFAAICLAWFLPANAQAPERRQPPSPEELPKLKSKVAEELKAATSDTARVRLLIQLASLNSRDNFNEAVKLGKEAVALADKSGHTETIARSYMSFGTIYLTNNRYDDALEYLNKGLPAAEKTGKPEVLQPYFNNLGQIYERRGVYEKTLDYYRKSYSAMEKMQTPVTRRAGALMQIGQILSRTGKYRESIEVYQKALAFAEQAQDWEKVSGIWYNIGNNYKDLGEEEQAEQAFAKSGEFRERDKKKVLSPANGKSGNN